MIRRAIDHVVSKERLARAFYFNLSSINLLEGICPEAINMLQDKQFTPDLTRILRNMKAACPPGGGGGTDDRNQHYHSGACRSPDQGYAARATHRRESH